MLTEFWWGPSCPLPAPVRTQSIFRVNQVSRNTLIGWMLALSHQVIESTVTTTV